MTKIKRAIQRYKQESKTYRIKFCIPPDYETLHMVEKTSTYAHVRSLALSMAASGNCIIMDIIDKNLDIENENNSNRPPAK